MENLKYLHSPRWKTSLSALGVATMTVVSQIAHAADLNYAQKTETPRSAMANYASLETTLRSVRKVVFGKLDQTCDLGETLVLSIGNKGLFAKCINPETGKPNMLKSPRILPEMFDQYEILSTQANGGSSLCEIQVVAQNNVAPNDDEDLAQAVSKISEDSITSGKYGFLDRLIKEYADTISVTVNCDGMKIKTHSIAPYGKPPFISYIKPN